MTESSVVYADPQGTVITTLRPPDNFEVLYQGQSAAIPIPLVPVNRNNGHFEGREDTAIKGKSGVDPQLVRGVRVGRDATLKLWFPILYALVNQALVTQNYQYQLHWRLRSLADQPDHPDDPWSIYDYRGVPATLVTGVVHRHLVPCAQGAVIIPVSISGDERPLNAITVPGALSQGVYDPDMIPAAQSQSDTFYEPSVVHSRGDELIITVKRVVQTPTTWDFTAADAPFSNFFGTDQGAGVGHQHPLYPTIGVMLYTTTGRP